MADLHTTQDAQRLENLRKLKAREDGIKANAIKQGYASRDAEWFKRLGVSSMEEATEIGHLRSELKRRITPEEERKHGSAKYWRGATTFGAAGVLLGAALVYVAFAWSQRETLSGAAEYGSRMVVSGAALQAGAPPSACIPGETLPDGRRCPMTTDRRADEAPLN